MVVSGGRRPLVKEAEAFQGTAPAIYVVGDNVKPGSVQETTNTAFASLILSQTISPDS